MKMEAAENRRNPEKRELNEAEPSLPSDPTEAAAWLKELWEGSGGWKSQHPLRLKVKDPKDYQGLSEEEKEQFDKLGSQFQWLAEMHHSEMFWAQSYARTNHGEVIGFRFGYDTPTNPEDNIPEAYIYLPFGEDGSKVFLIKERDGWHIEPLAEVVAKSARLLDY